MIPTWLAKEIFFFQVLFCCLEVCLILGVYFDNISYTAIMILNRKLFLSKSLNLQLICSCSLQVLKQLNVFAEEDIDTAAEALNDVSFYIFISQHAFYSYLCVIEFLKPNKLSTKLSLKSNGDYQL